jgi:GDP-L-fucose synthase
MERTAVHKRILVTGGSALVGTAVRAIQNDYPGRNFVLIGSKDCDLTDRAGTIDFVRKTGPDAIIHLAAISGGVGLSTRYPATLLRDNVLMNLNILEAARLSGVKKTVMTLSSGMYPSDAPNPLKEEYIHQGDPHPSNYSYSFAKRLIEPAIRAYRTEYSMNVIGLIPNGIFGENDNFNEESAPMLPSLIKRFYEATNGESKLVVWGDGSPLREYTYSKDVARAFMWALDSYDDPGILNVGTTEEHSVKEIALMVAEVMEIPRERIEFDTTKPSGIFRKSVDNSKFLRLSSFTFTPFRTGLEHTIRWFSETYQANPALIRLRNKVGS